MTDPIKNPAADQLEAGGTISGAAYTVLTFTDAVLYQNPTGLYIGREDSPAQYITYGHGLMGGITITSYTPPDPAPWWEMCDDDVMIEATWSGSRLTLSAKDWREFHPYAAIDLAGRNPRRVLVADPEAEVVVPRDALDKLRKARVSFHASREPIHGESWQAFAATQQLLTAVTVVCDRSES